MGKTWSEIPEEDKDLVRKILKANREVAIKLAFEVAAEMRKFGVQVQDESALRTSKRGEDALDAALEHLGFLP